MFFSIFPAAISRTVFIPSGTSGAAREMLR